MTDEPRLRRTFKFADFGEAFGFMTQVALRAERMNHHPDWSNSWNTVEVALWTHDASAVTQNDVELATFMNSIAAGIATSPDAGE